MTHTTKNGSMLSVCGARGGHRGGEGGRETKATQTEGRERERTRGWLCSWGDGGTTGGGYSGGEEGGRGAKVEQGRGRENER